MIITAKSTINGQSFNSCVKLPEVTQLNLDSDVRVGSFLVALRGALSGSVAVSTGFRCFLF